MQYKRNSYHLDDVLIIYTYMMMYSSYTLI